MKEKPILFSAPMIRAILNGTKSQTRRVVKLQPYEGVTIVGPEYYAPVAYDKQGEMEPGKEIYGIYDEDGEWGVKCPYGVPGEKLWVREAWFPRCSDAERYGTEEVIYRADGGCAIQPKWKPSIHMPRWASRLNLIVTGVRVERVQEISETDVKAEGVYQCLKMSSFSGLHYEQITPEEMNPRIYGPFISLWDSINKKRGFEWSENPFVWVIEFEKEAK